MGTTTQLHHITESESGLGFIDEVEGQAEWRSQKADEYPDDGRNEESAAALEKLAEWIRHHLDSPVVVALDRALDRLYEIPDFAFQFEPGIDQRLGRYGFNGPDEPKPWIEALVEEIEDFVKEQTPNESTIRSRGRRQGYSIHRSRAAMSCDNLGGYMIVDVDRNFIVAGEKYSLTLQEVAAWLDEK